MNNDEESLQAKELLNEIKRLRLEVQDYQHDSLTKLKTRKDFNKYFSDIWYEYKEYKHRFLLAMIDINGLHELNRDPNGGFEAGDNLIKAVGNQLKEYFEDSNIFRIGGDEFMVLKRGNDIKDFDRRLALIENCEVYSVSVEDGFEDDTEMFNEVDNGILSKKKLSKCFNSDIDCKDELCKKECSSR